MKSSKKKIGVFDSGFGGLNVLKGILKVMPEYNYVYLGDTARTPYGNRSQEIILEFTRQAVDFLFKEDCELIILACNTASSDALRNIQQHYLPKKYPGKKVLGVVIPGAEEAALKTKTKKVAVLATESTVRSHSYKREITKLDPRIRVFEYACPLLVPIVEAGAENELFSDMIIKTYLKNIPKGVDTIVLGCTHYGILRKKIARIVGKDTQIISGEEVIGKKLKRYLSRHTDIDQRLSEKHERIFFSTDSLERFKILGSRFLGQPIVRVKKASLL